MIGIRSRISKQFIKFLAVGGAGFIADGGLLLLLTHLTDAPYLSRLISFPIALGLTWTLNRRWTFGDQGQGETVKRAAAYTILQVSSAGLNFLIYSIVIQTLGATLYIVFIGFLVGSTIAMFTNYLGAKHFVFK